MLGNFGRPSFGTRGTAVRVMTAMTAQLQLHFWEPEYILADINGRIHRSKMCCLFTIVHSGVAALSRFNPSKSISVRVVYQLQCLALQRQLAVIRLTSTLMKYRERPRMKALFHSRRMNDLRLRLVQLHRTIILQREKSWW